MMHSATHTAHVREDDRYPSRHAPEARISPRLDPVVHGKPGDGPLTQQQLLFYEDNGYLGFDALLREAWEAGIVLTGGSAGMICWYEACVTDSFGPQLEGLRDGLGFLAGSACPHYDGEERRRPRYRELVGAGFPAGIAADDGVALRYDGAELAEVVTVREGARAYRVDAAGETPIAARLL